MLRPSFLLLLLAACATFSACKKCDPPQLQTTPGLTTAEQQIIPNNPGDTLHFSDNTGKRVFLVCRQKELQPDGFATTKKNSDCEDIRYSWNKLTATFSGNLVAPNGTNLSISATLSGGLNAAESAIFAPTPDCPEPPGARFFTLRVNQQQFYGYTEEATLPVIQNFIFRPVVKLEGQVFQNINANRFFATSTTRCPAPSFSGSGPDSLFADSIYYSRQYGLLRFTTLSGRQYQRQL